MRLCGFTFHAQRLADYAEIVLPVNKTIPAEVRRILEKLPPKKLKILQPGKTGMLDEYGKMTAPLGGAKEAAP